MWSYFIFLLFLQEESYKIQYNLSDYFLYPRSEVNLKVLSDVDKPEIDLSLHQIIDQLSAASMDVGIGYYSDPNKSIYLSISWKISLAHFCEHMLFMGSSKYPEEAGFSFYIRENSSKYNAYAHWINFPTSLFHLFSRDSVDRELRAIQLEFELYKQSNLWRLQRIEKTLSSKDFPYYKFGVGIFQTLITDPKNNVKEFYKTYSTNLMKLVVYFSEIPNKDIQKSIQYWYKLNLGIIRIKLTFPVETQNKASDFLHRHLLAQEWLVSFSAYVENMGLAEYQVIVAIFQYLKLLKAIQRTSLNYSNLLNFGLIKEYSSVDIKSLLNSLRPDEYLLSISSSSQPGNWNLKKCWYESEYKVESLPEHLCSNNLTANNMFKLSAMNKYISKKCSSHILNIPVNYFITGIWKMIDILLLKHVYFYFSKCINENNTSDITYVILVQNIPILLYKKHYIYINMLARNISEIKYYSETTRNQVSIFPDKLGFQLLVLGYSDKLFVLYQGVLDAILKFVPTSFMFNLTLQPSLLSSFHEVRFSQIFVEALAVGVLPKNALLIIKKSLKPITLYNSHPLPDFIHEHLFLKKRMSFSNINHDNAQSCIIYITITSAGDPFYLELAAIIDAITDEEFEVYVNSITHKFFYMPENIFSDANLYWDSIFTGLYHFDFASTALDVLKNLTKDDLKLFSTDISILIHLSKPKLSNFEEFIRKLLVKKYSDTDISIIELKRKALENYNSINIWDPVIFKSSLRLSSASVPSLPLEAYKKP
ncbi:hypothetical protein T552_04141 [Pneumocystis carinii B80]|uniref:Peptidase M16 N-terminal domain-containing protein n=1 Tax=Pneumocystis carinii (strain B80) TaxID=1408658 RepID=A0A0W4ZII0_PNEC8|nr:hypothetical protein T552_04141 [Pneumocystis carinii B80]KTW28189.1 hypothetical protein T552_04141 [Pneumocystis carinii B80]